MRSWAFVRVGSKLIPIKDIEEVDISSIEAGFVTVFYQGKQLQADGIDAYELIMLLKPSALEGLRLSWPRGAWILHNLIGHPVVGIIDILATPLRLFGWHRPAYRFAVWFHDFTTPAPRRL